MSTDILNLDLSFKHEKNNVGSNKKVFNFQKINTKRIYLPWVEKYRPNKLDNIILDSITKTKIVNFIQKNEISNMIMTGHPGTGKTSTIKCLAKDIFKEDYKECVIELNASDNRGLETINNSIIHFCKKKVLTKNNIPKLIILDEADNITKKAQNTLTNLMEKYNNTTKFAFTCNDYNKLVEGIQSRCIIIKYNTISNIDMKNRLIEICNEENVEYDDSGLESIIFIAQGDARYAINCLESTYFGFSKITYDNVYKICEKPPQMQVLAFINQCLAGNLKSAVNAILKLKNNGYCNNDILLTIMSVLKEMNLTETDRISMVESASNAYMIVNSGVDTDLQLLRCICDFFKIGKK
jgi:replication factor C subunit 2/4